MRRATWVWGIVIVALASTSWAQQRGERGQRSQSMSGPGSPGPGMSATSPTLMGDRPTTQSQSAKQIMMNLSKGIDVNQIITFISEQTGKTVLPDPELKGRIRAYSAEKLTQGDAMQLIYKGLELAGVAVIETPKWIELVPAEKAKTMKIPFLRADESASSITNKTQMVEKVFKLITASPRSLELALKPLIGKQGNVSVDESTRAIFITDTVANIERFEQIIDAFDRVEDGQIVLKIFKLENANADELADLVATMAVAGEGGKLEVRQQQRGDSYSSYRRRFGGSSGGRVAGDVVVLPDARTNWLIVAGPPDKVARIEKMVLEMDVPGRSDVKVYVVNIEHADSYDVASDIGDILRTKLAREKQQVLDVRASSRGNQLLVLATPDTYKMIEELVKELDTVESVQREARTYDLKYMDANDMADQLNLLYEEESRRSFSPWDFGRSSRQQAKFVPSTRTNSLMVIAPPGEYEFIEKMIKELDVEIPMDNLAPRVYHITHTDATDMVTVLTDLFEGRSTQRQQGGAFFDPFRWRSATQRPQGIGALYGKVRFVVYRNTNSIVVITNNSQNFAAVEQLIKDLDVLDPEATNMLVIQLQYTDAAELSNNLNNLLSEGAVTRGGQQQQRTQQQQPQGDGQQEPTPSPIDLLFPWQSGQRRTTRPGEEERPISSLIGHIRIVPDVRSQKLIVAAPSIYFDSIKQLVTDLDKPEPQVQLETYIVRVGTSGERRLGWRWTPDPSTIAPEELDNAIQGMIDMGFIDTFAGRTVYSAATGEEVPQPASARVPFPGGAAPTAGTFSFDQVTQPGKGVLSAQVNLTLLLQLLVKNTNATVMAHPQVTVNNNERGEIFVGEYAAFPEGQVTSTEGRSAQITYAYRDVGTRLQITPQINKQGRVVMRILVENERLKPERVPPVTERQTYTTKLTVENGQTVWLGGLSEQREEEIIRRFPLLGHIPFFGVFFRKSDKVTVRSDLYTFVTPRVIMDAEQADAQYQRAKERIRQHQEGLKGMELKLPDEDNPTTRPTTAPKTGAAATAPAATEVSMNLPPAGGR